MISFIVVSFLIQSVVSEHYSEVYKRFQRRHVFPDLLPTGEQSVNEYQFISPHHVKSRASLGSGVAHFAEHDSYSLVDISPLVISNNDVVTVSYKTSIPSSKDWIGAYSPANVDITKTVPVKYGWADEDANYYTSGTGSLTFNFTNLRADIAFYYFTNSTGHPILVADAPHRLVSFKNNNEPLKPRVVATGDYDIFSLLWSSATSIAPTMKWGTTPGKLLL
jgi:hypothetical protein